MTAGDRGQRPFRDRRRAPSRRRGATPSGVDRVGAPGTASGR
jgi:hypothetical protein